MSVLEVKDLHVSVETEQGIKSILNGVNLRVAQGEIRNKAFADILEFVVRG